MVRPQPLPFVLGSPGARFPIPQAHAVHRSLPSTVAGAAMVCFFAALMFVPGVSSLLRIDPLPAAGVAVVWVTSLAAATTAYHVTGLSWLYLALDLVESLGVQLGVCFLIFRSGNALSFLWLAYLGHLQMVASVGFSSRNLAVIAAGPVALALAFWSKGDPASAWLSLLVGAMGSFIYSVMARVYLDLEQTRAARSAAQGDSGPSPRR